MGFYSAYGLGHGVCDGTRYVGVLLLPIHWL